MNANCRRFAALLVGALVSVAAAMSPARGADIKRAAPNDAHMAMYAHRNPEREFQREYFAQVWQTIQDERIVERIVDLVASRIPEDKLARGKSALEEVQTALDPINWQALWHADEFVVVQAMQGANVATNNTLVVARMTTEDAEAFELGMVRLFGLIQRWSDDKLAVQTSEVQGTKVTTLAVPAPSPMQPAVARVDDLLLVSTSLSLLEQGVAQLHDESLASKFDDPRLQEALAHLPAYEDSLVFLDGQQMFGSFRGVADMIRRQAPNDPKALRIADVIERAIDQAAILDYQVTVEYTENGQIRTAELGKLTDGYQETVLGRAVSRGQPFEDWQRWIPEDATAYSVCTGISLHELYDGVTKFVRDQFPESEEGFAKFAEAQEKIGVNLDRDVLQSFSGETISVTVPIAGADGTPQQASIVALKCQNPDKIRELLGRAVEGLNKIPAVQAQQLKLADCQQAPGFQELQAAFFPVIGVKPVIGFSEGWMIVSCSPAAVEKVLAVRAGKAPSIDGGKSFARLGLDATGPTLGASYRDISASVRQLADGIDKVGVMAPMFVGMMAANAKPEDLKTAQDAVALLPSIAKVVRKMDFFEHKLSVTREGPLPNSYLRESVIEVRQPKG